MTEADYDRMCAGLPGAERVVQWGDHAVWKVMGKVFAIGGVQADGAFAVTFKCTPVAFEMLRDAPGVRPAPYLASRGMTWLQRTGEGAIDTAALGDYLAESWRLVAAGLPKAKQAALGLASPPRRSPRRG